MNANDNNVNPNQRGTLKEWKKVNNSKTGNSTNAPRPSDIVNQKKQEEGSE